MPESESVLRDKSFEFALSIIQSYKSIIASHKEFVLSKQLLKSGTSIGAQVREGAFAQSKPDFISKLSIALKEANETEYWLLLLKQSNFMAEIEADELLQKNRTLIKMLIASIKTAKNNLNIKTTKP